METGKETVLPASVKAILVHLGLPGEPPRVAPVRGLRLDNLDQAPAFDPADPESVPEHELDQTASW